MANIQNKHGDAGSKAPEYMAWKSIIQRCSNQNSQSYKNYGGRGIIICQRWRANYTNFLDDMGRRPDHLHSIDRIDNNGHYEPDNCEWRLREHQANNTRANKWIEIDGERKTLSQWAKEKGLSKDCLISRLLKHGWSEYDAVMTPIQRRRKKLLGGPDHA